MKYIDYEVNKSKSFIFILLIVFTCVQVRAQRTFVHPGGSISNDDIANMKAHIDAKENPWYSEWLALQSSKLGQSTYVPAPNTEIGGSDGTRQRASADATAALYNAIEWRITGETRFADCAARILTDWGNTVETATAQLYQFPCLDMCLAGEMLYDENGVVYSGWAKADRDTFLSKVRDVFVPACRLQTSNTMTSWSAPAAAAIIAAGVLLEDEDIYNEGLAYYRSQDITGSVYKLIGDNGQVHEMARDNVHANLGLGSLAYMAQIAWNQGDDLFAEGDNRLLRGYDFWCQFNSGHDDTPYIPVKTYYNDSFNSPWNWYYIATHSNSYRLRPDGTNFEILYHHFKEVKELDESNYPYLAMYTKLGRPERDYRSLFYPRDIVTSPIFTDAPGQPTGFTVEPGLNYIQLVWDHPATEDARGYKIYRSTDGSNFSEYYTIDYYTNNKYRDNNVEVGVTYYYKVAFINLAGVGPMSGVASAAPVSGSDTLPDGWAYKDINTSVGGGAVYSDVQGKTIKLDGGGNDIWYSPDAHGYAYTKVEGDFSISACLRDVSGNLSKAGLLARETLEGNSKRVAIHIGDLGFRLCVMNTRFETDGGSSVVNGCDFTAIPAWLKIERIGDNFSTYQSRDGVNWHLVGTKVVKMGTSIYAGFFVSSRSTDLLKEQAVFDHIVTTEDGITPDAPAEFSGEAISSTKSSLSWSVSDKASTYNLSRSKDITGPYEVVKSGITTTSYIDSDLEPSTTYNYVLKAANIAGESLDSAVVSITTLEQQLPPAPTGVKATPGNNTVALQWNATLEKTTGYVVKRSTYSSGPFTVIDTTSTNEYIDNSVFNDTTYYYVVSAINSLGEGSHSIAVSVLPTIGEYIYFPFDETTGTYAVCSWSGKRMSLNNTGYDWTSGKYNSGIHLISSGSTYLTLGFGIVSQLNDFTISTWVKLDSYDTWARIFDFGTGTTNYAFLAPKSGSGYLRYAITTGSGEEQINTTTTIPIGVWTHIVLTQQGSTGVLYVNGNEVGRNNNMTLHPSDLGFTTQNYLGKSQWPDPYLNGTLDEFRIYKRVLSPVQIQELKDASLQTISFDSIPTKEVGDPDFSPAIASSGLPVSYRSTINSVASIVDGNIHIVANGTSSITASQSGNLNFVAALPVTMPLVVRASTGIDVTNEFKMSVYPNPVSDILHIETTRDGEPLVLVELLNQNGVSVIRLVDGISEVDMSKLSQGIYFLKCVSRNGSTNVFKIIKK